MSVTITAYKRCSVRLYLQLFVGGRMSYLRYLCLLTYSGVQLKLCCGFVLFSFVLCILWIVIFRLPLRYSLDCPFSIVPSVFSGLSFFDCPFGILWIVLFRLFLRYSLDCPFSIAPSVFSGLSFFDCSFGILWIVLFRLPLRYSLDCPFLIAPSVFSGLSFSIAPSVFSNVYYIITLVYVI